MKTLRLKRISKRIFSRKAIVFYIFFGVVIFFSWGSLINRFLHFEAAQIRDYMHKEFFEIDSLTFNTAHIDTMKVSIHSEEISAIEETRRNVLNTYFRTGGLNIKKQYTTECLSIFIIPPSLAVLEERLKSRGSESAESLQKRLTKAKGEIAKSEEFDKVILNDNFDVACKKSMEAIQTFIG